jgi:uncharacterized protein (TIGR03067 family)
MRPLALSILALGLVAGIGRAQEDDLTFEHNLLRGTWVIQSFVENGENYGKELVAEKFTRNGLIAFGNRMFRMVDPDTGAFKDRAFRIMPKNTPKQMDIITKDDDVLQGIYKFDGDRLIVCLRDQQFGVRPTEFRSTVGSHAMLNEATLLPQPRETAEQPAPPKVDEPNAQEVARAKERQIRQMSVGKWLQTDAQGTVTIDLRDDGTFTSTRTWSQPSKKLFVGTTVNTGRWGLSDGTVTARVTGSTDRRDLDQVFSGKIQTISPDSITYTDLFGRMQRATRLR